MHALISFIIPLLLTLLLAGPSSSTRVLSPPEYITNELTTPRMIIGNYSDSFNFTSELAATDHSCCYTHNWTPEELEYYANKVVMVRGFQGCSYETVGRVVQAIGVKGVIFQSRQRTPGKEATCTDGKKSHDIHIPLLIMGNKKYDELHDIAIKNTLTASIVSNKNPWQDFTDSPAPVVIQMLGAFLALLWIITSSRGLYYSIKLQGFSWHQGRKVQLTRCVLTLELVTNCIRFSLFATDPFLIKTDPLLSWSAYVTLLIIHVPIGFVSNVCYLFFCLIIMFPSRVHLLKGFFVAITLAILSVDLAACGTNAAYRNPRGVDIYSVSFTLDGIEGVLIGVTLAITCAKMLAERDKQIRYSPRALKRLAILGLGESFFLLVGAVGSFTIAWLAPEAAWLDVFTLCLHWIGIYGASGCQIACFPKGKRVKKIKVIKVVDDSHTSHPMRKIVL